MAECSETDYMAMVLNPQVFLPDQSTERILRLLVELEMLIEDFDREVTIMYLAGNYSTNKHLCVSILRGKHDHEIQAAMLRLKDVLKAEIKSRKKK